MLPSLSMLATAGAIAAAVALGAGATASIALMYLFVIKPARSPVNGIPGPASAHWFFGNVQEIYDIMWTQAKFPEPLLSWYILLTDPEALKHVLTTHSDIYPRDDGTRMIFRVLFTKLTLDIIGVSAFSYEFDALAPHQDKPPQTKQVSVVEAIELLITPPSLLYIVGILLLPWFPRWPLPAQNQRRRARRRLFEVVDAVLASKLSPSSKPPPSAASLPKTIKMLDLVDLMLTDTNDHKVSIDEARIHTTSTTLSWVFAMLAQHADVEAKVRAECRHVLASNNHSWDWKALGELKYTTAVIHETLRLFPTASMLATRVCVQDNDMPTLASVNEHAKPVFIPKVIHAVTFPSVGVAGISAAVLQDKASKFLPASAIHAIVLDVVAVLKTK
ncbi:hypothetical protein DYB30_006807 [Aphanomyces astaci]|uniref:Cytochrome P450 n=1 Tax=Aphanomyces astaci TaxID=112090 RepID=A0A397D5C3_APHAT|nr:hypothetical protein DYB30_006807 [Aphanomyces astaci]